MSSTCTQNCIKIDQQKLWEIPTLFAIECKCKFYFSYVRPLSHYVETHIYYIYITFTLTKQANSKISNKTFMEIPWCDYTHTHTHTHTYHPAWITHRPVSSCLNHTHALIILPPSRTRPYHPASITHTPVSSCLHHAHARIILHRSHTHPYHPASITQTPVSSCLVHLLCVPSQQLINRWFCCSTLLCLSLLVLRQPNESSTKKNTKLHNHN